MVQYRPREFKFVGGPSRKRHRPNGTTSAGKKACQRDDRPIPIETSQTTPDTQGTTARPRSHHRQIVPPSASEDDPSTPVADDTRQGPNSMGTPFHASSSDLNFVFEVPYGLGSIMNPSLDQEQMFSDSLTAIDNHLQFSTFLNLGSKFHQNLPSPSATLSMDAFTFYPNGDQPLHEGLRTNLATKESDKLLQCTEAWATLIARYNREFCALPLTHDFDGNPFRQNVESGICSELLLHCILAFSYKHLDQESGNTSEEAQHHKERAIHLLKEVECEKASNDFEPHVLDAVLILMTLDCATSAHGPWYSHLRRAKAILEAADRSKILHTPRLKAKVGMLVWWDVTLALTSRQGCVLPSSIVRGQVDSPESKASPFFSISGCPEDLFRHMIKLSIYAGEYEATLKMTCVKFDMELVLIVERQIRNWSTTEFRGFPDGEKEPVDTPCPDFEDAEESAQYRQDLYHCAEAWRYALLLYIERIFRCNAAERSGHNGEPKLTSLSFLARRTLNNVASCRKSCMVQKQLLLPVFLAGCETNDELLMKEAREYCDWWQEETRYDMFLTAAALLQEVWDTKDTGHWWGSVLDRKTRASAGVGRQYLFG